jgi:RimJ/RimL family protein N-acetyltransferase
MIAVKKIGKKSRSQVIGSIRSDVIRHVFAFYDIQYDPEHTTMYAAFKDDKLEGYVLTYTATDVPSVILECSEDIAAMLLEKAPENNFILHTPPHLLAAVQEKYPSEKHYSEKWMLVKKGEARYLLSERARKLEGKEDASCLAELLSSRKDRPKRMLKRYTDWISRMPLYGVFLGDELVSYAGSFIQLPQVWMIGGVYTAPKHRSKGYATWATSAVTEQALNKADAAALFVRSDNDAAIKIYKRIGYKEIGEKVWVDVGTGLRP